MTEKKDRPMFPVLYEFRKRLRKKNLREKAVDGAIDHAIMGAGQGMARQVEDRVLKRARRRP
jgi:hypothetical protein